ncbi:MAG: MtnX-like HAD-IB family phosphatase [Chloroflexi bacterium]|nr:MtnX-like HAD-IB family phosphatase [Chloroflexota bacterium]
MSRLAIVIDFDGTITTKDVGLQIIEAFGTPGWDEGIIRYRSGEFGSRELHEWEATYLESSRQSEMRDLARNVGEIRPGFKELLNYARSNDIPLEIASSGWSFYIDAILEKFSLSDVKYISAKADFSLGETAVFTPSPGATLCDINGICKCDRVRPFQRDNYSVVFVGDGLSDFCVSGEADVVFARGSLAQNCEVNQVNFTPFEDFFDVLRGIEAIRGTGV